MTRVTLKEVAERAGVDVSTASRALNPEKSSIVAPATRLKVIEAAQALGYRTNLQASSLRRGRSGIIGVIVADLSNPFIGPVIRGVAHALGGRGMLPIMTETRDSSREFAMICDKLLAQRVDGLITTAARYGDRALLGRVAADVTTVLAVRGLPGTGIPSISHDDRAGGRLAAEHLLALGHRRVAQLMGPQDIWSFEGRAGGFRETVEADGATCDDVKAQTPLPTLEAGRQLIGELLGRDAELPTAIFAHNDTMAIGALAVLREHGIECPAHVSLIGYNDVPLTGYVDPPLTTIRLPGYELGRLAAELVISPSGGSDSAAGVVQLAPELVVRASTGPPRASAAV